MAAARACEGCGRQFTPREDQSRYCDHPECRREYERRRKAEQRQRRDIEELVFAERAAGRLDFYGSLCWLIDPEGCRDRTTMRVAA